MQHDNRPFEQAVKIKLGNWEFEAFVTQDGSLGFNIDHPMGGALSTGVMITPTLRVLSDGRGWDEKDFESEMALIDQNPPSGRTRTDIVTDRTQWMNNPNAAYLIVRTLQGFHRDGDVWRRNGAVVGRPMTLHHDLAVSLIKRVLGEE